MSEDSHPSPRSEVFGNLFEYRLKYLNNLEEPFSFFKCFRRSELFFQLEILLPFWSSLNLSLFPKEAPLLSNQTHLTPVALFQSAVVEMDFISYRLRVECLEQFALLQFVQSNPPACRSETLQAFEVHLTGATVEGVGGVKEP